jgi:putative tryptophan/tyrosine transport system substrate-binding protein
MMGRPIPGDVMPIRSIRRREFIAGLGGAAAWPLAGRAQQRSDLTVGVLGGGEAEGIERYLSGFAHGLAETGYVEGKNIAIEYRWARGEYDLLGKMADDLVSRQVAVIAAYGTNAALAAKAATTTIPIVFENGGDPIASGLVENLNHPGGNVTGVNVLAPALIAKRLELLHEAVPQSRAIATLVNPKARNAEPNIEASKTAAAALGLQLIVLKASTNQEIDAAFAELSRRPIGALLVGTDIFLNSRSDAIAALAASHRVPAIYGFRSFAVAGGLMSYGTNEAEAGRIAGLYTGRVLKGEKPGDLPVQLSTKIELVINLKTAKALGLEIPPQLLARADEVIE